MKNVFKSVLFMIVLVLSAAFVAANPVITPVADQTVNEGALLKVSVASTTPDSPAGSPLITKLCQPAPCVPTASEITIGSTKANFTNLTLTTAEFQWQPDFTQAGTYTFNLNVSDGDSSTNDTFVVTVNNVPPKLTVTETLALGGDNQERSNPRHDTENKREINVTGTITVKNDGPEQLNDLKGVISVASGFTESDLKINFTLPKTTLAVGESISVPVSVRVPEKLDAVTQTLLVPSPFPVATIAFSATSSTGVPVTGATQIRLQAENHLEIVDKVKIFYNDKSKSVGNDDTVKDIKAGQEIEIEVNVKNSFVEREDVEIQDVTVRAVSGALDIDEEEDLGDLSPQDKETVRFITTIDEDADDNTYDLEITVDGKDEFGARHGERIIIRFEIKRKAHDIEIKGILVNPPSVSCDNEARVSVSVRNSGKNTERSVVVRVASPELSFGAVTDPIELSEDDEDTMSFTVPVAENVPRPANYRINVETYYSTSTLSNSDVALLKVDKCGPAEEQPPVVTPPKAEPPVVVVPPTVTPPQVNDSRTAPEKTPFIQTPQYLALLGLGYLVVIGGGAALLIKLLRRP